MLESGITARILADSGFSALCADRICPLIIPEDSAFPAVSYQTIAVTPTKLLSGENGTFSVLTQFDVYARTYAETKQVFATLRRLLDGYAGALTDGTNVLFAELESAHDLFESDARLYRLSADFRFITTA